MLDSLLLTCALVAISPACRSTPAEDSGLGWKMVSLDLDIDVDPAAGKIRGHGSAVLELAVDSSRGPTLGLNARGPLMHFTSASATPAAEVRLNESHPLVPNARLAHLRYEKALAKGARVTVECAWESDGSDSQFVVCDKIAFASWVQGWYPIPVPEPSQSLARQAAAPGKTRMHLPRGWSSVSNGVLHAAQGAEGDVVDEWDVPAGVARSFAAGPYHVASHKIGEREISVHRLTQSSEQGSAQAQALARALQAQEQHFGPYPYASYRIAEVPEGFGSFYASSEMGFIMAKSSAFDAPDGNLVLFAHEMAHGWWGNLVQASAGSGLMCDEALAQYSAVVAIEGVEGASAAADFLGFSRTGYSQLQCAAGYFQMAGAGKDQPLSKLVDGLDSHNLADAKGHWVYHMLRERVGDELFFDVLRDFIRDGAKSQISLASLRQAFVDGATADLDLETFFAEWLDRPGAPVVELEWNAVIAPDGRPSTEQIEVRLRQAQEALYHLPLELEIETSAGAVRRQVELDERDASFTLDTPGRARGVRLDPDCKLLLWRPEYGPRPTESSGSK